MILSIQTPEPSLVRNSDSWRLAYIIAEVGEGDERRVLVDNQHGLDLWREEYLEPIDASDLDRALMDLRRDDIDAYEKFRMTMLGYTASSPETEPPILTEVIDAIRERHGSDAASWVGRHFSNRGFSPDTQPSDGRNFDEVIAAARDISLEDSLREILTSKGYISEVST